MGDQNKDQNQDRDSEPQHQDQDKTVTFITIQLDGSSKAAVVNTNSLSPASVRQWGSSDSSSAVKTSVLLK